MGPAAAACTCARSVALLPDAAPPVPAAATADLLVTSSKKGTALLVAAAWVGVGSTDSATDSGGVTDPAAAAPGPYGCGTEAAVRQAKERLDWQGWLLVQGAGQRGGPSPGYGASSGGSGRVQYEPGQVTKLVLLVGGGGRSSSSAKVDGSVLRYLQHSGVRWLGDWEVAGGSEAAALALEAALGGAPAASSSRQSGR